MKRWFMSFIEASTNGRYRYCSTVMDREEHPVAQIVRWNKRHAPFRYMLLSFCEVDPDVPEMDETTHWLGG